MFGVRAWGVRRRVGWLIGGLHETVREEVFFDLFTGDVGEHHPVNLDAGERRWPVFSTISA